jgi:DNA (cytosine-5)-methyltransferase 1
VSALWRLARGPPPPEEVGVSLDLTVTDLFCGAGGSSIGAEAMGARLRMAANHWPLAIETHSANFPHADHDCADVSQVDPRRYPSTDILLASPECTHHSQARSNKHRADLFNPEGDPAAERSRATMWDVPRFAERHRYQLVFVENVVEVAKWAPFDAWLQAMGSLGYRHRLLSLNSMVAEPPPGFARAPQSRDRLYVVFWREGNPEPGLEFRPRSWCWGCEVVVEAVQAWKRPDRRVGKYRQQYVYRCPLCSDEASPLVAPALAAIDLSIPCPRIGDRARPLAPATRRRIEVGIRCFVLPIVQAAGHTYEAPGSGYVRAWAPDQPMPAQTTTLQHGIACPPDGLVVPTHHGENGPRARSTDEPLPTQTGRLEAGFVMVNRTHNRPRSVDEPFAPFCTADHQALVVPLRRNGRSRSAIEPLPAFCAAGSHHALVVKNYGQGDDPSMTHPVSDPMGTVTTQDHHSLVALPFVTSYYGKGGASATDQPMPTQTVRDRHALVDPAIEVDDCGFRMFEPPEIGRGMAFPEDYTVEGTKRDRVKLYGNAVTPPTPAMVLERCVETLA